MSVFLEPALDRGAMFPHRWQGSNGRFQQQSPSVSASLLWHRSVEMDLNYPALASASWKPASPWLSGSGTGKCWLLPLHFLSTAPPSAHYPSLQSESHPGLLFLPLSLIFNPSPLLENFPSWVLLKCRLFFLSCNWSPRLVADYPSPEMPVAAFRFPSLMPTSAEPLTSPPPPPAPPPPDHFSTWPPEKINLILSSSPSLAHSRLEDLGFSWE